MVSWIVHMQPKVEWLGKNMTKKRMGRVAASRKAEKGRQIYTGFFASHKRDMQVKVPLAIDEGIITLLYRRRIHPSIHPLIPSEPPPSPPLPITYQLLCSDAPPRPRCLIHFPLAMNITPVPHIATFPEFLTSVQSRVDPYQLYN